MGIHEMLGYSWTVAYHAQFDGASKSPICTYHFSQRCLKKIIYLCLSSYIHPRKSCPLITIRKFIAKTVNQTKVEAEPSTPSKQLMGG